MTALPSVLIDAAGLAGSVAADFDGDGRQDLVVAGRTTNLHVLLGDGAGSFTAAPGSPLATANGVGNLVAADFDGDGHPDLAGVSATSLVVYRNDFVWPTPAPPAPTPAPVVDAVSPAAGPTDGGEPVTISGQGFGAVEQVWFGDAPARFRVERFDRLVAVAPAHAAGSVHVRVQTTAGTSAATERAQYRYVEAPRRQPPTDATPSPPPPADSAPVAERCVVPPLRGLRLSAARKRLARAGCALGNVRRVRGARAPRARRVIRQRPAAGRRAPAGRHVAVTVRATRR